MPESFTVIFNSQGRNVINNAALADVTYLVNWTAFLPLKFKRFKCRFVFKSTNYAVALLANPGLVNMNLGKVDTYNGNSMASSIGIIYPVVTNPTVGALASYYNASPDDNADFCIDYPTNQQITIDLNTFAGATLAPMINYCLILTLEGIE